MLQRRTVFLVGYMGAGKTSVGRFVAEKLGWTFIDLDDRIQAKAACSIAEIFARHGESAFRRMESEALAELVSELSSSEPAVVALGGGGFANKNNAALVHEFGAPVIWLDAPVDQLWARTQQADRERPLRTNFDEFCQRYDQRCPGYSFGTMRVDTSGRTVAQIAAEVAWLISVGCTNQVEER